MSKKSPLNQAIGNIQSNKPRALPKLQTFAAPFQVPITPQDEKVTNPPDQKSTLGKLTPEDQNPSVDEKEPVDQNSPSEEDFIFLSKPKPTREEKLASTLKNLKIGYTRVPNEILMEIIYGGISKAEIKILLLIARYTLSFDERATASLSKADIERYTQLQGKSILKSLQSLVDKKLVIKIKGDQYTSNQLGLIFDPESFNPPPKKKQESSEKLKRIPPVKEENSPAVQITPQSKKVTHPPDQKGTHPTGEKVTSPAGEKSTYFKDSFSKNKSLSYDFPTDMKVRWETFEKSGKFSHSKKERENFQEEFIAHGKQFFDNCGKVISFLETQGNGKPGADGKIHSPMVWISGHWEINFTRYQNWIAKAEALEEAEAARAVKEAQDHALKKKKEEAEAKERIDQDEWQLKIDAATQRLMKVYPNESELNAFAAATVRNFACQMTQSIWKKSGWNSPTVRSFVIEQFMKIESQNSLSEAANREIQASA